MSIIDVKELLKESLDKVKEMIDTKTVIGNAITTTDGKVILPVTKITAGYFSSGAEINLGSGKYEDKTSPVAGLAGGVGINPMGFLIINGDKISMIKADGDNGTEKWVNFLENLVERLSD